LQGDLQQHKIFYQAELNSHNNVVTVAHSQGNLYVNEAFVLVSVPAGQHFNVVSVASPGDHVAGGGPWVTLQNDIILLVPFALPANTVNNNTLDRCGSVVNLASRTRCHDFGESYLTGDVSQPKIVSAVTGFIGQGQVIYSNFGPNDNFDRAHGFALSSTPGGEVIAMPFTTGQYAVVCDRIDLAIAQYPVQGVTSMDVWLMTNTNNRPGSVVEKMQIATVPSYDVHTAYNSSPPVSAISVLHPQLLPNTKYWVVAAPSLPNLLAAWYWVFPNSQGLFAQRSDNNVSNGGWTVFSQQQTVAFSVIGH
jgi:hypothetical protein